MRDEVEEGYELDAIEVVLEVEVVNGKTELKGDGALARVWPRADRGDAAFDIKAQRVEKLV